MNNLSNEMKLEFISKSNNEAFARITVAAFVAQLDPTIEELADIKTAVSEAVTNAIIHGYEEKQGIVTIRCHIIEDEVTIEVSDNGKGIENIEVILVSVASGSSEKETTNENGEYEFSGITDGEYYVKIENLDSKYEVTEKERIVNLEEYEA